MKQVLTIRLGSDMEPSGGETDERVHAVPVETMGELIRRWGRLRPLPDTEAQAALGRWAEALGVGREVQLARVDRRQVTDHRGRRGGSLVGVTVREREATLYHTRRLMVEDLVHELLHVGFPHWPEGTVVEETARILGIRPCPENVLGGS